MALPETNFSLIARMKRQADERAWQEFVTAYEPLLLRMMTRRGLSEADSRDIVQQVFMAVCRSLDRWTPDGEEGSFRRWLSGVTRNTMLKFLRARRSQPLGHGGSDFLQLQADVPCRESDSEELLREYAREVFLFAAEQVRREFRDQSWQAFWRTAIEGQSVENVARDLRIERGALYMSRSRIMARIRSRIAELGEQEVL